MKQFVKTSLLFIFFCLISCEWPGEYRDIEISIENVDHATTYIYSLPDSIQLHREAFDREYQQTIHISGIPDGHILIKVSTDNQNKLVSIDTTIWYKGRFKYYAVL